VRAAAEYCSLALFPHSKKGAIPLTTYLRTYKASALLAAAAAASEGGGRRAIGF